MDYLGLVYDRLNEAYDAFLRVLGLNPKPSVQYADILEPPREQQTAQDDPEFARRMESAGWKRERLASGSYAWTDTGRTPNFYSILCAEAAAASAAGKAALLEQHDRQA